jgi:hypothetical protein
MEGLGDHGLGEHGKYPSGGQGGDSGKNRLLVPTNATAPTIDAAVDAPTTIAQTPRTYVRDRPA